MWSTHSRRSDPISRSAKPFCQREAGAVGLSRMPMARNDLIHRRGISAGNGLERRRFPAFLFLSYAIQRQTVSYSYGAVST
jgi:hypothetical protein